MKHLSRALVLLSLGAAAPAFGQATLTILGNVPGNARDVAPDGMAATGTDGGGAYLWTSGGGAVGLAENEGVAISNDGLTVLGGMDDGGFDTAGLWTQGTGWVSLGGLGGTSGTSQSSSYDLSGDGTIAVGLGWINAGTAGAFRWTQATGMMPLPQLGPNSSRANSISNDGTMIGGWDEAMNGTRRAAIWDASFNETLILAGQASNPDGGGEVCGFSDNNRYACGTEFKAGFFYDTMTSTITNYGQFPGAGFFDTTIANSASNDGQIVVGIHIFFPFPRVATIWTPGGGLESLQDYIIAQGGTVPGGVSLENAMHISGDGTTIVGTGFDNGQPIVWEVVLAGCGTSANFCTANVNSTGSPAIIASDDNFDVAGNNLTLTASPVPNQPGIFFYGAAKENGGFGTPFGNGFQCVGGGMQIYRLDVENAVGNVLTHDVDLSSPPVPSGQVLAGSTWNFQGWYRDPMAGGANFNLTDGLEITFCN